MRKRFIISLTLFIIIIVGVITPVESTKISGDTHTQPTLISLLNLLTKESCESLENPLLLRDPVGIDMKRPNNPSPCHDWIYPYPEIQEKVQMLYSSGINFYPELILIDRGYILKEGDYVGLGDTIKIKSDFSGEWFKKGGPEDCPPTLWVSQNEMKQIINRTLLYHYEKARGKYPMHPEICSDWKCPNKIMADKEIFGRDVELYKTVGIRECVDPIYGTLICNDGSEGGLEKEIKAEKAGKMELIIDYLPKCIYYVEKGFVSAAEWFHNEKEWFSEPGLYDHYRIFIIPNVEGPLATLNPSTTYTSLNSDWLNIMPAVTEEETPITATANITILKDCLRGPDLRIQKVSYIPKIIEGEPLYARLALKNTGDMESKLDKIKLNVPAEILYSPKTLKAGEESEIIIEAEVEEITDLKLDLEYRSDKLGCLPTKEFKETFNLGRIGVIKGKCKVDSDCPAKELGLEKMVCCNSICKDLTKGFCEDLDGDGVPETWISY
ncbi:MAG: hypothetical protein KAU95_03370 [Candidatus Aenigmarchaeota archaeon]|nr:hypothetical protein [Candidatus Aenigmarchaeota archaeon]